jgi:anthranilate synthase component 1
VPVFAELPADLDTPLSAYLRLRPGPYSFLLESVEGGEVWARYSFLGTDPLMVLTAKDGRVSLRRGNAKPQRLPDGDPLEALRGLLGEFRPVAVPGLPRFQGGAVGYLAYDMVRHMERLPRTTHDDLGLPDAVFMLSDTLLVFDNLRHRLLVIANAHVDKRDPASLDRAYDRAAVRIGMTLAKLARPARAAAALTLTAPGPLLALGEEGFTSTMDEGQYSDAVRRAK